MMGPTVLFQDSLGFGAGELLVTMDPSGLGNQVGTKVFRVDYYSAKVMVRKVSFEFGRVRITESVFENGRILFKKKGSC